MSDQKINPAKPTIAPLLPVSQAMANLLNDSAVTLDIAKSGDSIDKVLAQIQLDIPLPENVATVGHEILALRKVREVFYAMALAGNARKAENDRKSQP